MTKTVHEIKEAFSSAVGAALESYYAQRDEIRAQKEPTSGGYVDRLSPEQRMSLLREKKMERAQEITEQAREAYAGEVEGYRQALSKRKSELHERLFKVENSETGTRAALATDTELGVLLEYAIGAGNEEMARAAFTAAEQRGLGDLMNRFFSEVDEEASGLYEEWVEIPPYEVLERQTESIETIIPDPDVDTLMPRATVWSS